MHELAVAQNIIRVVRDQLQSSGEAGRVTRVNVKVGRLTCVEPDALRLSFEALKRGTPLAGAILSIESVPIRGDCRSCQREFVLEEMELTCPDCGSFGIDLRTGRELLVDSLEVES